jgi:hypothetical protein
VHIDCFSCHAAIPTKFFGSHLSAQNAEGAQAAFRVPRVLLHGAGALITGGR